MNIHLIIVLFPFLVNLLKYSNTFRHYAYHIFPNELAKIRQKKPPRNTWQLAKIIFSSYKMHLCQHKRPYRLTRLLSALIDCILQHGLFWMVLQF